MYVAGNKAALLSPERITHRYCINKQYKRFPKEAAKNIKGRLTRATVLITVRPDPGPVNSDAPFQTDRGRVLR